MPADLNALAHSPLIAAVEAQLAEYRKGFRPLAQLRAEVGLPPKCSVPVDVERCVDRFMYLYINYLGTQLRQTWARG